MRVLYYDQNHTYRLTVPPDAPELPPDELYRWLQQNRGWVFDGEKLHDLGDVGSIHVETEPDSIFDGSVRGVPDA
nr:hypothetical protein 10 [Spirochaetaceae bacterium]